MKKGIVISLLTILLHTPIWAQFVGQGDNFFEKVSALQQKYELERKNGNSNQEHEGSEYSKFKRWLNFWMYRVPASGDLSDYMRAQKTVVDHYYENNMTPRSSNTDPWHSIGPLNEPLNTSNGSNCGTRAGIGPVRFVVMSKSDNDHLLTGSYTGGLFLSTDAGDTWANAGGDEGWNNIGCSGAVFHPANSDIFYATSNAVGGSTGYNGGVYRTTNGGTSWDKVAEGGTHFDIWGLLNTIVVNPSNPDECIVTSNNGLFICSNLNAATPVFTTYASRQFPSKNIYDIDVRPGTSEVFITVASNIVGSTPSGLIWGSFEVYKSTNFGTSWSVVSGMPSNFNTNNTTAVTIEFNEIDNSSFFILRNSTNSNPCPDFMCTSTCDANDELWEYNIAGGSASLLNSDLNINHGGGHGFGVAPTTGDYMLFSFVDRYAKYDNGTFTRFTSGNANKYDYHVDCEDFLFHPSDPSIVYMASHGGIHKSTDYGSTWVTKNNGLAVAEGVSMSTSYLNPSKVALGLYHDGCIITNTAYGAAWEPDWDFIDGTYDGQEVIIGNVNKDLIYVSSQGGNWERSMDEGLNFTDVSLSSHFFTKGDINQVDNTILYRIAYSGGFPEIQRSFSNGTSGTNQVISNFASILSPGETTWQIFTSEVFKDIAYVKIYAAGYSRLFVNKFINDPTPSVVIANWVELPYPTLPTVCGVNTFDVSDLQVSFEDEDIIYISRSSRDFCSNTPIGTGMFYKFDYNNLSSPVFTDLTHNLPNTGIGYESIAIEKGSDGGVYVGTDFGVFYTNNKLLASGSSTKWIDFSGGLPNGICNGLEINYQVNTLRANIYGRGVWEHNLYCPDDYDLDLAITHSTPYYYEVEHDITSRSLVPNTGNITYRAGNKIVLQPPSSGTGVGFKATAGCYFHAFIHPCGGGVNSFRYPDEASAEDELYNNDELLKEDVENIVVYPNPSDGIFSVQSRNDMMADRVFVYDLSGKLIANYQQQTVNGFQVDLSGYPNGTYFLRIESTGKNYISKLVKK